MRVRLTVDVDVSEPEVLTAYAIRAYGAAFGDTGWRPANIEQAVLEALVLSAPGPTADQIGVEIAETSAQVIRTTT